MLDTLGSEALVDEQLQPPIRYAKIPGDPGYVDYRIGRRRAVYKGKGRRRTVYELWDAESCLEYPSRLHGVLYNC